MKTNDFIQLHNLSLNELPANIVKSIEKLKTLHNDLQEEEDDDDVLTLKKEIAALDAKIIHLLEDYLDEPSDDDEDEKETKLAILEKLFANKISKIYPSGLVQMGYPQPIPKYEKIGSFTIELENTKLTKPAYIISKK